MRKVWLLIVLVLALALSGCGGGGDSKSEDGGPSVTPFVPTPLPPTWTPSPQGFVPSPTVSPTPEATVPGEVTPTGQSGGLVGGTPFPPTWTPGRRPSPTSRYTPTMALPTVPPAATWTLQPDYCYTLVGGGDVQTVVGKPVVITWTPIATVPNYMITVRHPGGGIMFIQVVRGESLQLSGDLFTVAGAYGWEAWPLDEAGQRICFPVSGEIVVSF